MCMSKVYIKDDKGERIVTEEAAKIVVKHGEVKIYELLGESRELKGYHLEEIDLLSHEVILRPD